MALTQLGFVELVLGMVLAFAAFFLLVVFAMAMRRNRPR